MTPANASLANALILIAVGCLGYFLPEDPSPTALIPVGLGVIIALLNPGVRAANKVVAHIAVTVTLLILLMLFMPLKGAIGRGDGVAIGRVALMQLSTLVALVVFIKSFIEVRKAKKAEAASGSE